MRLYLTLWVLAALGESWTVWLGAGPALVCTPPCTTQLVLRCFGAVFASGDQLTGRYQLSACWVCGSSTPAVTPTLTPGPPVRGVANYNGRHPDLGTVPVAPGAAVATPALTPHCLERQVTGHGARRHRAGAGEVQPIRHGAGLLSGRDRSALPDDSEHGPSAPHPLRRPGAVLRDGCCAGCLSVASAYPSGQIQQLFLPGAPADLPRDGGCACACVLGGTLGGGIS